MLPLKRNGKYVVCVSGASQGFGVVSGVRKPDGITVHADGRCVFSEYAGGFDGFWSTDAGDGHEDGLALAAKRVCPVARVLTVGCAGLPAHSHASTTFFVTL
jgi:hypothetical protein